MRRVLSGTCRLDDSVWDRAFLFGRFIRWRPVRFGVIYEDELTRGLMRKFDGFIVMLGLIGYKSWCMFGDRRWAATGHSLRLVFGR